MKSHVKSLLMISTIIKNIIINLDKEKLQYLVRY